MDSAIKLSTGISRGARIAPCYLAYNEHLCTPSFIHDTPTYQVVVVMMVQLMLVGSPKKQTRVGSRSASCRKPWPCVL